MSESDFSLWEKEQSAGDKELKVIQHTLDLAQELQLNLVNQPPDFRKDMGIEALKLLNGHPNNLKHRDFAVHVQHAYLHLRPKAPEDPAHTLHYGEMRLIGRIGYYVLQGLSDADYILSLQLFDPKQLECRNIEDKISARLPEPLSLPVAAFIDPPILIK
ncbi:MAG: hypothetical protein H6797_03305 [Candidatus Nomurabacteria bacterium]|nr:MAG: hypothetical protein H6797_03305 [Candidatus Nomurabacteria bacterium]